MEKRKLCYQVNTTTTTNITTMAKKLKHEDLILNIIVNGNPAQSEIGKLSRTLQDAKSKVASLKNEQKQLEKQGKRDTQQYKNLTEEIRKQNAVIDDSRKRITDLRQTLKLEEQTIKDLEVTLRKLNQQRKQSIPGSESWKKYVDQINVVQNRLTELRSETALTSNAFGGMANSISRTFTTLIGGGIAISTITSWTQKATEVYTEYDDKIADVMKTTNTAHEEVIGLSAELDKIITRTSDNDLLGLGRIGGKLGISDMDELRGFIESSNQLIVALNEDLGGDVEGTINAVGKLAEIFKVKDIYGIDDALLKIGSSINELGAASSANEGYMVDFSKRMAGVAPLAGITIQETLALAATLDQLGQTSEVSSTSLSKLFLKMSSDAEKYAKYAGMSTKEFKKGIETDFMPTFIKLLDGVKGNSEGLNELAATLGDLGIDAQRTTGVIGSLAGNTKILQQQIDLANKSFEEGTSLTDEYNIKNSNAAAQLEISRKGVTRMWREMGEKLWPVMTEGNNLWATWLKVMSTTITFIANNIRWITALTVSITAFTIAVNAAAIATYLKSKAIAVATIAQRAWNAVIAANPIGLLIAGIVTATAVIISLSQKTSDAAKAQDELNKAKQQAVKDIAAETSAIERNLAIANDRTRSDAQRLAAVQELRKIMPKVLQDYTDEAILSGKATAAIKDQVKELIKLSTVRAYNSKLDELAIKKRDLLDQKSRGFRGATFGERVGTIENFFSSDYESAYASTIDQRIKSVELQEKRFGEEVIKIQSETVQKINSALGEEDLTTDDSTKVKISGSEKESERRKNYQKELDDAEKHHQDMLQKEGLFREDLSELTKEQLIKMSEMNEAYQTKVDDVNKKYGENLKNMTNAAQVELKKREKQEQNYIDALIRQKQKESDIEFIAYQERLTKAGIFNKKYEEMDEKQKQAFEILHKQYQDNIAKIDADAIKAEYDRITTAYDTKLADLRIQHNEELSSITTLAQAKDRLSDTLSAKELSQIKNLGQARKLIENQQRLEQETETKQHLENLLKILQTTIESEGLEGIKLSDQLLSEEEMKTLEGYIRKLKEELAKLKGVDKSNDLKDSARNKVDVLGMSPDDWVTLFDNLQRGKFDIDGMKGALEAAGQLWNQYNRLVSNKEDQQIAKDEQANNKKKESLQKRLDAGTISQESYNKQIEQLDKQLDRKKATIARNQAKRDRNVALMSSIVNTAAGIVKVLADPGGIYGMILAAIVGSMGALQIGTIAATPLPEIPGLWKGGKFGVTRAQDGRHFDANIDPNKRGYIDSPTVLVGEDGTEFVASAQAVRNPNVKPVIDIIDTAQRQGRISSLTASEVMAGLPGRASGGYFMTQPSQPSYASDTATMIKYAEALAMNNIIMDKLSKQLDSPIQSEVVLTGKKGLIEKQEEYNRIIKTANL